MKSILPYLLSIIEPSHVIYGESKEQQARLLRLALRGQRYLIVLDDLCDSGVLDDLLRWLIDERNGSRIICTTRNKVMASPDMVRRHLQVLSPLTDNESWKLLRKKLFRKERCPQELVEVGRRIAKNCNGLPIVVITTASRLGKVEKTAFQWEQVEKSLESPYGSDLRYRYLPDNLKPCLLYLTAFLEDKEIRVTKLIRLWIAEGFIQHTVWERLEDVAYRYLIDLIDRRLVTVAQEKDNGGPKFVRVHYLLYKFCVAKAEEENFLLQISDNLDYGMHTLQRRFCIHSQRNHFIRLKPYGPFVRTLLFTGTDMSPSDVSFMFLNFKYLRTLDFEDINIGDSLKEIDVLVLLRYLAVQGDVDCIPSSAANLWNLETFIFKGLSSRVVRIPDSILDMAKLRHLEIKDTASFDLKSHRLESSSMLNNLQTFSTPSLAYGDDTEMILRRLKSIRKLKCILLDSWDDNTNCNQFPDLRFLRHLVSLRVFYNGQGKYPCQFNFPTNLKKLTLSNFRMPWSEISPLARIPCLEVLKLLNNSFEGERWEMKDEMFHNLKFLKLDTLNLVEWITSKNHFPRLERLILHKCKRLMEIPSSIVDINSLQIVEVLWCGPSLAISARNIHEGQQYIRNESLEIRVHPEVDFGRYSWSNYR